MFLLVFVCSSASVHQCQVQDTPQEYVSIACMYLCCEVILWAKFKDYYPGQVYCSYLNQVHVAYFYKGFSQFWGHSVQQFLILQRSPPPAAFSSPSPAAFSSPPPFCLRSSPWPLLFLLCPFSSFSHWPPSLAPPLFCHWWDVVGWRESSRPPLKHPNELVLGGTRPSLWKDAWAGLVAAAALQTRLPAPQAISHKTRSPTKEFRCHSAQVIEGPERRGVVVGKWGTWRQTWWRRMKRRWINNRIADPRRTAGARTPPSWPKHLWCRQLW